jgi:hypothetical protein
VIEVLESIPANYPLTTRIIELPGGFEPTFSGLVTDWPWFGGQIVTLLDFVTTLNVGMVVDTLQFVHAIWEVQKDLRQHGPGHGEDAYPERESEAKFGLHLPVQLPKSFSGL